MNRVLNDMIMIINHCGKNDKNEIIINQCGKNDKNEIHNTTI